MKKGVVMESNGKWTVVLTPEGEFMKIPSHPHHLEGKEVSFRVSSAAPASKKKKSWTPVLMRGVALTAACLLFLVMVFPFFGGSQAYAAVTFDINPSLELEVDEQATVIEAIPFNDEAKKLLQTVQWEGKSLSDVTMDIIDQAERLGYMNEERQVLITATYLEEEKEKENITQILEEATSQANEELTVVIVEGSKEWHEEAKKKQVPPGAYMLVKQAEEQGIELKEKEWKADQIEEMPPVKGVTIIHPKGNKKDNEKDLNKAKEEKKPEKKKEESGTKQDVKDNTIKQENQKKEESKENKKEDKKDNIKDREKPDDQRDNDRERDDRNEAEDKQEKNKRSDDNQKYSHQKEKGPIGPPSHVKNDSSANPKKDDNQKKNEKDDHDRDDSRNKKDRD